MIASTSATRSLKPRRARRPAPRVRSRPRPPTVLIVDDLRDQRELYVDYLRQRGFGVVEAANGVEAIAAAVDVIPDVVLMDLAMPGLDGYDTTRVLKSVMQTRHIPVIALTAHGEHMPGDWAHAAGCDRYLRKPILPMDLEAELRLMLRARG